MQADTTATIDFEANEFAMELLMPAEWVARDAAGLDLADDAGVQRLAQKYRVPTAAMALRLGAIRALSLPPSADKGE